MSVEDEARLLEAMIFDAQQPRQALAHLRGLDEALQRRLPVRLLRLAARAMIGDAARADQMFSQMLLRNPEQAGAVMAMRRRLQNLGILPEGRSGSPPAIATARQLDEVIPADLPGGTVAALIASPRRLDPGAVAEPEVWTQRLRLGVARTDFMHRLFLVTSEQAATAPELAGLYQERLRLFSGFGSQGLEAVTRPLARGRTVVVLQGHGGFQFAVAQVLSGLAVPLTLVGNRHRSGETRREAMNLSAGDAPMILNHPQDLPIGTLEPGMALTFARLCKSLRKTARVIRILPDGPEGQGFAVADLAGHPVRVATGAAALAFYGRAALVFARTEWQGDHLVARFFPGPVIGPELSLGDAERLMVDFYIGCWQELLLSDPINFGLNRAWWNILSKPGDA